MNIYDISKQAGVSIATVSRVLNGSPNVKPKTRKKVMDVIEQFNYTPNAFARGLGLDSMNSIGLMCADSSDLYLAKAVYYIEGNLRKNGYNSILTCSGYEHDDKEAALALLINQRVDAVIMVGSHYIESDVENNRYILDAASHIPVLLLNADLDCPNVFCAMCDDFKATQDATLALLDSGIKDILYLYNSHSYSGMCKLAGYQSAYGMQEIAVNSNLMQFFSGSHEDIDGVCSFLSDLRKEGLTFHAVLASEDMLAAGAVKYAKLHNISIPDELSIIGYNNSLLTTCSDPEITSIDNHLEALCYQLVKTCIGVLNGEEMPPKIIYPGELIHKATTNLIQNK
ncbi:MAG: LacI family DNA-binding transcriptional regulator [Lachnospiraceae bacterium]|nr:LacI family DNA-binding transcriptional regulator [Lachnospiraceae bacterium]